MKEQREYDRAWDKFSTAVARGVEREEQIRLCEEYKEASNALYRKKYPLPKKKRVSLDYSLLGDRGGED